MPTHDTVPAPSFQVTSVYLSGFKKALSDMGLLEAVTARVSAATKAVLDAPFSARTHDGAVLADLSDTLRSIGGGEKVQEHAYVMARDALARILIPMFKVALALTGRSPATLLSRLGDSVEQATRGVRVQWQADSANGGKLRIDYPVVVSQSAEDGWRGSLKFLFELVEGMPATITKSEWLNGQRTLLFHISW